MSKTLHISRDFSLPLNLVVMTSAILARTSTGFALAGWLKGMR